MWAFNIVLSNYMVMINDQACMTMDYIYVFNVLFRRLLGLWCLSEVFAIEDYTSIIYWVIVIQKTFDLFIYYNILLQIFDYK